MGNLESSEGGAGEPPSVSLLPPPGKMPMPEPCELEERFALVLVRAEPSLFPSYRPPGPSAPCGTWPQFPRPAHPFSQGFRQTPASSGFPGTSEQPPAGRDSPIGDLPTDASTAGCLGERVPSSGLPQDPDFFPAFPAFCCPSYFSPASPTVSPGP